MPSLRRTLSLMAATTGLLLLAAGCGGGTTTTPAAPATTATPGGAAMTPTTSQPSGSYPRAGHAPDYSWIAGRVTATKIQAGCTYIFTSEDDIKQVEAPPPTAGSGGGVSGPTVGTSTHSDVSPPLRDITPETGPPPTQPPTARFVPSGPGWDPSTANDGDYVVLFGRLAGPGDTVEMCPGGIGYVVTSVRKNP